MSALTCALCLRSTPNNQFCQLSFQLIVELLQSCWIPWVSHQNTTLWGMSLPSCQQRYHPRQSILCTSKVIVPMSVQHDPQNICGKESHPLSHAHACIQHRPIHISLGNRCASSQLVRIAHLRYKSRSMESTIIDGVLNARSKYYINID